ncbi:OLC1v1014776C2 [Oldenlandia corymbosa var. corymbosa]|uniref:OLC1v1014776C2 n=1 Tax=Oldenlandia corymbosa var. corymbosa TaxID=529605 RepID=A0AAV1E2G0_OLDCO|nr:OLC1v1014776C2 [Oldenlandia corymbosa var. corymbosa]
MPEEGKKEPRMADINGEMEFPAFPYRPYSIQLDFMKALYQSLEKGGIAMLESPTGTGKTLSIICSALQWLVDKKQKDQVFKPGSNLEKIGQSEDLHISDDEPDWMKNFTLNDESKTPEDSSNTGKNKKGRERAKGKKEGNSVRDIITQNGGDGEHNADKRRMKALRPNKGVEDVDDGEFLMDDYESENEDGIPKKRGSGGCSFDSSSDEEEQELDVKEKEEEAKLKIYFCSRTHSQLSQFIKELRKTKFACELKVVSLGSRKNFCINEEVLRLGNSISINERCLELQKNKKIGASKMANLDAGRRVRRMKAPSRCPMLRSHKIVREYRSEISQQGPLDIEDLVKVGNKLGTCPYYGSRSMVPGADLVILPYQSLLSKSSRESLGLNLKNNIVIIDEAHNLADSLITMYDARITLSQLERIHSHLEKYLQRFYNLLGPGNRRYIQTLMVLTSSFLRTIASTEESNYVNALCSGDDRSGFDFSMALNDFLFSLNIDNINLIKLLKYIEESNIIHKVSGYGDKLASLQNVVELVGSTTEGSTLSGFRALFSILSSLTNNDGDGRIIVSRARNTSSGQQGGYLKYVMLTGEKIFSEIVQQTHAIILAGGTLQPIEETKERLFPWLLPEQFHFFSCSHIVPPANILPIAVSQGPSGQSFDFSYNARNASNMIEELGLLLCNLAAVVPEGIVVFFSSFDYESKVHDAWKTSGILARIMKKKRIFREPRKSTDVELLLNDYKDTIDKSSSSDAKSNPASFNGAVLFAVVGGKVSEGINFSDGMGRCIVMVGLPFPSPSDIELMERVKYIEGLDSTFTSKSKRLAGSSESSNGNIQAGFDILRCCKRRGRQYYENLCMKAVNQSIGRAIRHVNDYAVILLVDVRYTADPSRRTSSNFCDKLPQWIRSSLVSSLENYGIVHKLLHQFFKFHRTKEGKQ